MAIKATDLDNDFRVFEKEDGTIDESVTDDSLGLYWHESQEDSFGGEESSRVKKFFDYIARRVFLPWLSALTKAFNSFKKEAENKYLKTDKVKDCYDPQSGDPMSGKAVAEAVHQAEFDEFMDALRMTGQYVEAHNENFWKISLVVKILEIFNGKEGTAERIPVFVRNVDNNLIYILSAVDATRIMKGEMEPPKPILDLSMLSDCIQREEAYENFLEKDALDEIIATELAKMPARKGAGSGSVEFGTDTCKAIGNNSLAGGAGCNAEGKEDIALGLNCISSGKHSMSVNSNNKARQADTFVHGCGNTATGYAQRVGGRFCQSNANMAEIIGNGTDENHRSNAYALDWEGNAFYSGAVYAAGKKLLSIEKLLGAMDEKIDYQSVAKNGDSIVITEEMVENGLFVKANSEYITDQFTWSLDVSGVEEFYGTETYEKKEVAISGLTKDCIGKTACFSFIDLDVHGGSGELYMAAKTTVLSKKKLEALLNEEVSEG